jgi:hypothetical protein
VAKERRDVIRRAKTHRFIRNGIWYVKLAAGDVGYRLIPDSRGYVPEHILIAARALDRPIGGHERVRWFSANHLDNRPENLFVETPTGFIPLASPKAG